MSRTSVDSQNWSPFLRMLANIAREISAECGLQRFHGAALVIHGATLDLRNRQQDRRRRRNEDFVGLIQIIQRQIPLTHLKSRSVGFAEQQLTRDSRQPSRRKRWSQHI